MAEYKTLGGLDLDIGGFTESITSRSKKTLEEVSRKNRGIGAKPETEEIELDDNFLKGIAQLFRDNGYEPTQLSEDVTTTPKDEVLDEYSELMKSEIIQDVMKEVSTLGESPNKLEDIYTSMDTDFVTLENQPTVDSEGELLEIEQTEPLGLMSKPSGETLVDRTESPSMPDEAAPTEEVSVDKKILSPAFLNAIGITGSLTEEGVQTEVKKILKEQGISDEEAISIIDNSISADEVQPTDGKVTDLLDFIGKGEGGYNSAHSGTIGGKIQNSTKNTKRNNKKLTELTIGEIKEYMDIESPSNKDRLFAVGKYQFIPDTFDLVVEKMDLSDDQVFTPELQEKMGTFLLTDKVGRKLQTWLYQNDKTIKKSSIDEAMLALAKEFASIPVPYAIKKGTYGNWPKVDLKAGDSYYSEGISGGNKAQHTVSETKTILNKVEGSFKPLGQVTSSPRPRIKPAGTMERPPL